MLISVRELQRNLFAMKLKKFQHFLLVSGWVPPRNPGRGNKKVAISKEVSSSCYYDTPRYFNLLRIFDATKVNVNIAVGLVSIDQITYVNMSVSVCGRKSFAVTIATSSTRRFSPPPYQA